MSLCACRVCGIAYLKLAIDSLMNRWLNAAGKLKVGHLWSIGRIWVHWYSQWQDWSIAIWHLSNHLHHSTMLRKFHFFFRANSLLLIDQSLTGIFMDCTLLRKLPILSLYQQIRIIRPSSQYLEISHSKNHRILWKYWLNILPCKKFCNHISSHADQ